MDVDINFWAVLLAALSTMVVGSVWYSPAVFGKMWMKMTGVKADKGNVTTGEMVYTYGGAFVLSLLTAYVLAHFTFLAHSFYQADYSFLQTALITSAWAWLGFTAARIAMHDMFESRRKKLTLLNVAHEFVTIMVMGLVIGLMGV